jgi:hypothetical protein
VWFTLIQEWLFTTITVRPFIALSIIRVQSSIRHLAITNHPALNVTSITRTTTGMVIITVEDKKSPVSNYGAF